MNVKTVALGIASILTFVLVVLTLNGTLPGALDSSPDYYPPEGGLESPEGENNKNSSDRADDQSDGAVEDDRGCLEPLPSASHPYTDAVVNRTIEYVMGNHTVQGMIVSDRDHPGHRQTLKLGPHQEPGASYLPENASSRVAEEFLDLHIAANQTGERIWVSPDENFSSVNELSVPSLLPAYPPDYLGGHVIINANHSSLTIAYIFPHHTVNFVKGLLNAYQLDSSPASGRYLELAERILSNFTSNLWNGKFHKHPMHKEGPRYNGLNQGIVMEALHKFVCTSPQPKGELRGRLQSMAEAHEHTTEGVQNHWANSILGSLIRNYTLEKSLAPTKQEISDMTEMLWPRYERHNGKIPYVLDPDHPKYPAYSETYHTYDTMLLSKLALYVPESVSLNKGFELIFEEATDINYLPYFAYNSESLLFASQIIGYRNDSFATSQEEKLSRFYDRDFKDLDDAITQLHAATSLDAYRAVIRE